MPDGENRSPSAAKSARTANKLTPQEADRLLSRLRSGMERLAKNAERLTVPDRIVLSDELSQIVPVDPSTWYRWERDPRVEFPRAFDISGRLKGRSMGELMRWYIRLLESRDGPDGNRSG